MISFIFTYSAVTTQRHVQAGLQVMEHQLAAAVVKYTTGGIYINLPVYKTAANPFHKTFCQRKVTTI